MDRKFVLVGFSFAIIGICLGIYMAASNNHSQFVTHTHILLIGFVLSFIYGLCHKLWINVSIGKLAKTQFYIHVIGALIISAGLFLVYGGFFPVETMDPILAGASIAVLIAAILMFVLLLKSFKSTSEQVLLE